MGKNIMLKLKDFIGDRYLFLDFDGTLVPYRANSRKVYLNDIEFIRQTLVLREHMLDKLRPVQTFKQGILELDPEKVYILSTVETSIESRAKDRFLAINYPTIPKDNIIYVSNPSYKVIIMEELYKLKLSPLNRGRSDIVLIDDTLSVLQSVEAAGFSVMHVSEFIE